MSDVVDDRILVRIYMIQEVIQVQKREHLGVIPKMLHKDKLPKRM